MVFTVLLFTLAVSMIWQRCAIVGGLMSSGSMWALRIMTMGGLRPNETCDGSFPIIEAVKVRSLPMVQYLLASKAEVNVHDRISRTPLMWAAEQGEPAIAAALLAARADVNAVDNTGQAALRYAVRRQHNDIARQLVNAGADVNNVDRYRETPLIEAAAAGNAEIVRLLIAGGADRSKLENGGRAAIDYLPRPHDPELVRLLRNVYFVPMGEAPTEEISALVDHYREKFGLQIEILPAVQLDESALDKARGQWIAEEVMASMLRAYPDYARNSSAILIGITAQDIYPQQVGSSFSFGWRDFEKHAAVASTARLGLHYFGEPRNEASVAKRLDKVITKDLGILFFEKEPNNDPKSVLYAGIGGIQDLDNVGEDF